MINLKKLIILTILTAAAAFVFASGRSEKLETVEMLVGGRLVTVEIADNDASRQQGLMYRDSMPEMHGMIFVFEADQMLSFWMKNTKIPLAIAYISSNGQIREIHEMEPLSQRAVQSSRSVRYALEMNSGWFERNSVSVGDFIEVSVLNSASIQPR